MDEAEVNQIAQELLALLGTQSIPVQYLSVTIGSPLRYIKSIVSNFPIRRRSIKDIAVTVSTQGWDISIGPGIVPPQFGTREGDDDTLGATVSDSAPMDESRALDIAAKIQAIFDQHGLEVRFFRVLVKVPTEYYESIKHQFRRKRSDSSPDTHVKWKGREFGFQPYRDRTP
jgi:hypothetical protein